MERELGPERRHSFANTLKYVTNSHLSHLYTTLLPNPPPLFSRQQHVCLHTTPALLTVPKSEHPAWTHHTYAAPLSSCVH